jgi:hypothetical protein
MSKAMTYQSSLSPLMARQQLVQLAANAQQLDPASSAAAVMTMILQAQCKELKVVQKLEKVLQLQQQSGGSPS